MLSRLTATCWINLSGYSEGQSHYVVLRIHKWKEKNSHRCHNNIFLKNPSLKPSNVWAGSLKKQLLNQCCTSIPECFFESKINQIHHPCTQSRRLASDDCQTAKKKKIFLKTHHLFTVYGECWPNQTNWPKAACWYPKTDLNSSLYRWASEHLLLQHQPFCNFILYLIHVIYNTV